MAPSKTPQLHGNPAPKLRLVQGGFRASAENDTGAFQGTPAPAEGETAASEAEFFLAAGIGKPHVAAAATAARLNATSIERELIAQGLIDPPLYYRWLAAELNLDYIDRLDLRQVVRLPSMDALLHRDGPLRLSRSGGQTTVIVPEARTFAQHKARLEERPSLRDRLAVASPATIRQAVWETGAAERIRQATFGLDEKDHMASARHVLTGWQGFASALTVFAGATCLLLWPLAALTVLHLILTLFFAGGILLRLSAMVWTFLAGPARQPRISAATPGLPVYTVLIALRDEADMAPAIVSRISALDWPKSLLDIKFICEAGDAATIDALRAQNLGSECEIVIVPDFGPRTKPKALQYALQGARGSLVAVYDAEDKPAAGQLLEAWAMFRNGGEKLACLQAPLAIANLGSNWIAGLFALEYSGLFRVLVPFLDRTGMPIPLGGTSNHFRSAALEEVGGWDPHNVTEDADLGMRLYRRGYRTKTLCGATIETAPDRLDVWIRQRTRWLKGWAQTWLVMMRQPVQTYRALGFRAFVVFQLMIAGMLISALAHPFMFFFIGLTLAWLATSPVPTISGLHMVLMWVDLVNITGSYLTFVAIGWRGFVRHERVRLNKRWLMLVPAYWLVMSWAGWRALHQLIKDTHLWEKTPHRADGAAAPQILPAIASLSPTPRQSQVERVKGIEPSS